MNKDSFAQRHSAAAHSTLAHANPLAPARVSALLDMLAARAPRRALDLGCGPGAMAWGLAERTAVHVSAIDTNECFLARARADASGRRLRGQVEFELRDAATLAAEGRFDAVLCVGASQVFGSPSEAVAMCARHLAPAGALLFADLAWAKPPPVEFLDYLAMNEADLEASGTAGTRPFTDAGLEVVHVEFATREDWASYEASVLAGRLAFAGNLPAAEAAAVISRARGWTDAVKRWGDAFAFVATIAVVPGVAS